ncbi:MAG TPA: V-type ATP synthase subunit F [Methanothermococcus okinawensis]|uniref:A-type ATP synthase subunit F n=1 Tax=Methanothermococcus okinawensis TaxID=155863 RepID=A0A832ZDD4_9EURY|nr:V-type ATP synthase subunit F [Methanococcaceae archaeon]HIP84468.1 V-type ATP synthase subunit F [Methanothermococcus okinawensis]HIP90734.1 V-type ATP synthase subunit F [Methanothermococcus okinawensis]
MKIGVVGDFHMTVGFRLAGLTDVYQVETPEDAIKVIEELDRREDIGLIIISEKLGDTLGDKLSKINTYIVEVPDKDGPIVRERDPIRELVRKAVGIELKK